MFIKQGHLQPHQITGQKTVRGSISILINDIATIWCENIPDSCLGQKKIKVLILHYQLQEVKFSKRVAHGKVLALMNRMSNNKCPSIFLRQMGINCLCRAFRPIRINHCTVSESTVAYSFFYSAILVIMHLKKLLNSDWLKRRAQRP